MSIKKINISYLNYMKIKTKIKILKSFEFNIFRIPGFKSLDLQSLWRLKMIKMSFLDGHFKILDIFN